MKLLIVTGISGAGKSHTIRYLEDLGYYCVDNLPPELIRKFAEVCSKKGTEIEKVALGIDIRGGILFQNLFESLKEAKIAGFNYEIIFLDANDSVLVKRFKETRRTHPLLKKDRIEVAIAKEKEILNDVKSIANYIIDTSNLLPRNLKEQIDKIFSDGKKYSNLIINIISFGFKYGIPQDSDIVMDVRFIDNPFYIDELRDLTGDDKPVYDYVMEKDETKKFMNKFIDMLEFLIPNYIKEGKNQLVISIGCTGGKHRSVSIGNALKLALQEEGHNVIINHKDIRRDK